jgi:hypothetical protein
MVSISYPLIEFCETLYYLPACCLIECSFDFLPLFPIFLPGRIERWAQGTETSSTIVAIIFMLCVPGQVFLIDPLKIFPQVQCTQSYTVQNKKIWSHGSWTARTMGQSIDMNIKNGSSQKLMGTLVSMHSTIADITLTPAPGTDKSFCLSLSCQ